MRKVPPSTFEVKEYNQEDSWWGLWCCEARNSVQFTEELFSQGCFHPQKNCFFSLMWAILPQSPGASGQTCLGLFIVLLCDPAPHQDLSGSKGCLLTWDEKEQKTLLKSGCCALLLHRRERKAYMGTVRRPDGDSFKPYGARSNIRYYQIIYELNFSIFSQLFKKYLKHSCPLRVRWEESRDRLTYKPQWVSLAYVLSCSAKLHLPFYVLNAWLI